MDNERDRHARPFIMKTDAKLKITYEKNEVNIVGNREGLKFLAEVCSGLSKLSDEEARTPANHYHFATYFDNLEEGSLATILCYNPNL